ncbi:MAG: hypothetical protein IKK32_04540 [Oscillospiraceae bacterium]|nr:hypothetical protein [Oscillospiraceae bacterium]
MKEVKMTYCSDKTYLCDIYIPEETNHILVIKSEDIMAGYNTLLRNETEKLCEEKGIALIFPKCEEEDIIPDIAYTAIDTFSLPESWNEEITEEKDVIDKIKNLKSEDDELTFKFSDSLVSPHTIMQKYMKEAGSGFTVNRTLLKNWNNDKKIFDKYNDIIFFSCCMSSTIKFGIEETEELLASAGYMLTDSLKDRIIRYFFIDNKDYGEGVEELNGLFRQANEKIREANEKSGKKYGKIKEIELIKNPEECE